MKVTVRDFLRMICYNDETKISFCVITPDNKIIDLEQIYVDIYENCGRGYAWVDENCPETFDEEGDLLYLHYTYYFTTEEIMEKEFVLCGINEFYDNSIKITFAI